MQSLLSPAVPDGNRPVVSFTWFASKTAPNGTRGEISWSDLCEWIASKSPTAPTKNDLPLIKLGTFDRDYRSNETLRSIDGVEGDYDGETVQPAAAAEMLRSAGVEALIYTSPSHTANRPRWRVLAPLSSAADAAARHDLLARLNGVLGGILATESFAASQSYYVGAAQDGEPVQCLRVEGRCIDTIDGIVPIGRSAVPPGSRKPIGTLRAPSPETLAQAMASIKPDDLNYPEWCRITAAYRGAGGTRELWDTWCAQHPNNAPADNDKLWRSLEGGTSAGWPTVLAACPDDTRARLSGLNGQTSLSSPAVPARPYADMLNDAAKLLPDDADGISKLCREAGTLPAVHCEALLKAIHTATGVRLPVLRKEAAQATQETEPDQLALARLTIADIGADSVLHADEHFWLWDGGGVWKKRDDIAIKQRVQGTIERGGYPVTAAKVTGVTDVARSELYRPDHTFNVGNPDVVNCNNGELELIGASRILQPHRREHYRTTQIPVAFDDTAEAPMFWQFLHDVFCNDADRDDKVRAVLELIGYSLMSHAYHEKFVMLIGGGANGKSVLLSVIEALVGFENVAGVQPAQFASKWQRAHLHMKLANIVTELKQGEVIADAELKAISSGELTTVEFKNGQPFNMRAFATCWFGTNHLPHTRDFSDALFRRATILTFNRTFTASEQDHNLKAKLTTELPGILRYALAWYAHAIAKGFTEPASSCDAKHKWRMEADQVAQFVDERCVNDPLAEIAVAEIYNQFREWALGSGVRQIVGKQAMGDRLERLGYKRRHSGQRFITGLKNI